MTGSEKTVSSCFVKRQEYAQALIDKKKRDFDPSTIRFEGNIVPFDSKTDTVYIPQDCGSATQTGAGRYPTGGAPAIPCNRLHKKTHCKF